MSQGKPWAKALPLQGSVSHARGRIGASLGVPRETLGQGVAYTGLASGIRVGIGASLGTARETLRRGVSSRGSHRGLGGLGASLGVAKGYLGPEAFPPARCQMLTVGHGQSVSPGFNR